LRAFLAKLYGLGYDAEVSTELTEKPPISIIRVLILVAGILIVILLISLYVASGRLPGYLHKRAIQILSTHFESAVQIDDFHVALFPRTRVTIEGLVLRHNGRTDIAPLIQAKEIIVDASLLELLRPKMHISTVRLIGLQMNTPPHQPGAPPVFKKSDEDLSRKYPIIVDDIHADDALLLILRAQPGKKPEDFEIHHLEINHFSFDRPANFHAILTNPTPRGEINSVGLFGPWQPEDPSTLPIDAKYDFENADFSTIKGISGTMNSTGAFKGPLNYLVVHGETDTPNFALNIAAHREPLHTDYDAIVDGTNGNVILNSVLAKLRNSTLHVKGEVVDMKPGVRGRTIKLDVLSQDARIEDFLWLTVKADPPIMTGSARLKAQIEIGEADTDILQRMTIHGQFGVGDAEFTSSTVQGKIDTLSKRAQGKPKATDLGTAVSELKGTFVQDNGLIAFQELTFSVEGASIQLAGTYQMTTGEMDFRGKLHMEAKLSQTTTGVKSFFLKAVDPFFKGKNGGTDLPIKITGTKDHPVFGLDRHH
jgi:AsmA-like C-terminal region